MPKSYIGEDESHYRIKNSLDATQKRDFNALSFVIKPKIKSVYSIVIVSDTIAVVNCKIMKKNIAKTVSLLSQTVIFVDMKMTIILLIYNIFRRNTRHFIIICIIIDIVSVKPMIFLSSTLITKKKKSSYRSILVFSLRAIKNINLRVSSASKQAMIYRDIRTLNDILLIFNLILDSLV